jgi:Uma2 family endonuclease
MTQPTAASPHVRFEDELLIPAGVGSLEVFRDWMLSDSFPERGRIDYLQGTVEVDMSPEELQSHGVLKSALHVYIGRVVQDLGLGQVFVDRARFTSEEAGLSCEPDVLVVSWESLRTGRARYQPSSTGGEKLLEITGAVDLVVEVVSDSSTRKDTERLPPLFAVAGVRELWLADARGKDVRFRIHHLREGRYEAAAVDAEGFQRSLVLERKVRVGRHAGPLEGTWIYDVDEAR